MSSPVLHPAVQAHLDHEEPLPEDLSLPTLREHIARQVERHFAVFGRPGPEVLSEDELSVPVDGGAIRVKLYRPTAGRLPVHGVLHGGGWIFGSIDSSVDDAHARRIAVEAGCVVASIGYRLAPENPFPTGLNDAIAALRHLANEADSLNLDSDSMSLGGASAGANLAAAVAIAAPDLHLAGLVLDVPALDLTTETVRAELAAHPYEEDMTAAILSLQLYLPQPSDAESPLASPLRAPDLSMLPQTWVNVAELDPLRREGALFVERLSQSGVPAHLTCYEGAMHGSGILDGTFDVARQWRDDVAAAVRTIHREG